MMTLTEQRECKSLLSFVSKEDLRSLKYIVVGKRAVEDKHKTIKRIIQFSSSAAELLQRRKIRSETLFHYLASKSITAAFTAEKSELIKEVLAHWRSLPPVHINPKRSTSGTATASNTYLAAPTSQRSTSETATASTQPLQ